MIQIGWEQPEQHFLSEMLVRREIAPAPLERAKINMYYVEILVKILD